VIMTFVQSSSNKKKRKTKTFFFFFFFFFFCFVSFRSCSREGHKQTTIYSFLLLPLPSERADLIQRENDQQQCNKHIKLTCSREMPSLSKTKNENQKNWKLGLEWMRKKKTREKEIFNFTISLQLVSPWIHSLSGNCSCLVVVGREGGRGLRSIVACRAFAIFLVLFLFFFVFVFNFPFDLALSCVNNKTKNKREREKKGRKAKEFPSLEKFLLFNTAHQNQKGRREEDFFFFFPFFFFLFFVCHFFCGSV